ncbi:hypothetical protein JW766_00565 [Candidatus Dojkabacteria bacterium]|nr:hypothetical protein [Candidatus Dojkabacteria bacterium]
MNIHIKPIKKAELKKYLEIKDLTKCKKDHAIKLLYLEIREYMKKHHPDSEVLVYRLNPIVNIEDNYDKLLIPKDNTSRSSTYTHYVDKKRMLRTHTSAKMLDILKKLSKDPEWKDVVIMLPGLVYRRDITDKIHLGVCHQLDVWRVVKGGKTHISQDDLMKVIRGIITLAAPGWKERIVDMPHPYTRKGVEVNVVKDDRDIEILESGLINDEILNNAGLDPDIYSGWAMGMGLDRLVMTKKDMDDIRYIRSDNTRIAEQMQNLEKYREVSDQPSISRDMSYCVPRGYVEEDINDDIRNALGKQEDILESVKVLDEIEYRDLPKVAKDRLGCSDDQKNVLVRITLRHLSKTLTKADANKMYTAIYTKVNYGSRGYC